MYRLYVFIISCLVSFLITTSAYAFKVDTHIWVGQQVLNDIHLDGMVTIPINGINRSYPVRADLVSAIKSNPSAYRMGNVGPDGFPDIITGQQVVHPGAISWKTDDWLKWVTSQAETPEEIAFAYGYLSHAAADVFAHTYVNQYSGDAFDLSDEPDVEFRHVLLEQFISKHTPSLTDVNGNYIGAYYDSINVPAAFVTNNLIMNSTVSSLYGEAGLTHLKLIYDLREKLKGVVKGPLADLEVYIMRELFEEYTGVKFSSDIISDEELKKFREIYNDVFLQKIMGYQFANTVIDFTQEAQTLYVETVSKIAETSLQGAQDYMDAVFDYGVLNVEIADKLLGIADANEKISNLNEYFVEEIYNIVERAICTNGNGGDITLLHRQLGIEEKVAFQSTYNIVITPDGFPIIWNDQIKTKKIDDIINGLGRDNYKLRGAVVKANAQYQEAWSSTPQFSSAMKFSFIDFVEDTFESGVDLGCGGCLSTTDAITDGASGDLLDSFVDSTQDLLSHIDDVVADTAGINPLVLVVCPSCAITVSTGTVAVDAAKYSLNKIVESKYNYCILYPGFCTTVLATEAVTELFCEVDKVLERTGVKAPILNPIRESWKVTRDAAQEALGFLYTAREDLKVKIHDLSDTALDIYLDDLAFQNNITNVAVDLAQEFALTDVNPLRAYINGWIDDIDVAMNAYVQTNASIIKETMKPDGDPVAPLKNWFECEFFKMIGVAGDIVDAECLISNRLNELIEQFRKIKDLLILIDPTIYLMDLAIEEIQEKIKKEIVEEISRRAEVDIEEFVALLKAEATEQLLNLTYSTRTGKSLSGVQIKLLLPINDIAQRVTSEMQLKPDGTFDENSYAVIYNAIIFSKLSLLDTAQLNQLVVDAGVTSSIYSDGEPLHSNAGVSNILFDAIKSIDGNHQWMHEAPPYPRQSGDVQQTHTDYSYIYDGSKGFRLWQDPDVRDQVFLKIFKGPLVPGVDAPELIGYSPVLPDSYPYKVCEFNPYPLSVYDKTCIGGFLDGDNLDDFWELQWIGNLLQSGSDNPDNDQYTNFNEMSNGTNPLFSN